MEALVGFKAVSPVPITTAFDKGFCAIDVLLYTSLIAEKNANANDG